MKVNECKPLVEWTTNHNNQGLSRANTLIRRSGVLHHMPSLRVYYGYEHPP